LLRFFFIFIILINLISSTLIAGTINIAVAANVSYAINDLKKEFNTLYPNTKIQTTLGSSGKLTAQIFHGAPYQLFMSANMLYPNTLYAKHLAITKPVVYAKGSLAYFSIKKQDFSLGIKLLKKPNIKKIAIANPKTAPYGKATFEALNNANIYDDIKHKFIYAESISQTVSYSVIAADIGIIAKSSLYSKQMLKYKEGVNWLSVDTKLYRPISQGLVILKKGKHNKEVKSFYNFLQSYKAKKIFSTYGYQVN